MLILDLKI